MKYLYSRMLAGTPEPVAKPKKKAPKPKVAKPPKPEKVAAPKTLVTVPKPMAALQKPVVPKTTDSKAENSQWRSQPTGSNRTIVVPPPVNLFNPPQSPFATNIPVRKHSKENKISQQPNQERECITPKKTTETDKIVEPKTKKPAPTPTEKPVEIKPRGRPAKKAKLTSTEEQTSIEIDQELPAIQHTTSAASTKSKSTAKSTSKPTTKSTKGRSSETRGRKRTIDTDDDEEELAQRKAPKSRRKNKILPIISGTYKLSTVFKGHTDINVPVKDRNDHDLDDAKDIWCCEFEPHRPGQLERANTVAICGSYSVLLLDTQQGRYTKKYTHSEIQEIFYCMAWTTLSGSELLNTNITEGDQSCNILAIAGRLGSIKLLNPLQNECYRYLFGHDKAVLKLAFAKTEPRWLFSASADKTVRLWDIGSPTSKEDDSVCLAKFSLPSRTGIPSALSISYDLSTLMVGFDNGEMVSFRITPELLERFRQKSVEYRTKEARSGDKWATFGALATIPPKTIYPKGGEWHDGYVDDIYIFGQDGDTSSKLYNKFISRGADDMEFIVWNPEKSTETDADILLSLEWPDSAGCTGVRYKVIEAEGQKVLLAGEYDGQVYIYDIGNSKKSKTLADNSVEKFEPTRILSHSMSSELIRDVCCSNDTRTIVAVDNNNTVFVWNCTDTN